MRPWRIVEILLMPAQGDGVVSSQWIKGITESLRVVERAWTGRNPRCWHSRRQGPGFVMQDAGETHGHGHKSDEAQKWKCRHGLDGHASCEEMNGWIWIFKFSGGGAIWRWKWWVNTLQNASYPVAPGAESKSVERRGGVSRGQ